MGNLARGVCSVKAPRHSLLAMVSSWLKASSSKANKRCASSGTNDHTIDTSCSSPAAGSSAKGPVSKKRWRAHKPWGFSVRMAHTTRSEEHTSELQSRFDLVCRLLLGKN